MKKKLLALLIFFLALQVNGQDFRFSKQQIQTDLNFLELQLLKFQPNLYVYSSKKEIDSSFQNLKNTIPDSLTKTQSYNLISSTCTIVKDGHYNVRPDKQAISELYTVSKLLPLDIYWIDENAYIIRNYSDLDIQIGSRILSIEGVKTTTIRETILNGVLRDGNNKTYPNWILNNYLRAYYLFHFGTSDDYEITFERDMKEPEVVRINGLTYQELNNFRKAKYPEYFQNLEEEKGLHLKINKDKNTAILTIKSFENKMLKKEYNQKFRKTIRTYFKTIEEQEIGNLIIDIRGNQGGEVTNGIFLLKHLMAESFQAVQGFTKVDKKQYDSPNKRNKSVRGGVDGFHKPFKTSYQGHLYLLVNGGSFSCSGIVSQVLKQTKRGVLIGAETGGSAYTVVGAPNKEIILPNTQIQITIPLRQFILQEYEGKKKTGVMPDKIITPTILDIINNKDTESNFTLEMINN